MERIPVESSQIAKMAYDAEAKVLEIEFHPTKPKGALDKVSRVYTYYGVDPADWLAFQETGASIGKVFGMRVKGVHLYKQTSEVIHYEDGTTEERPVE